MWRLVPILLGSVLLLGPRSGWGCELPATGQTTCWDSSGNAVSCAGTGQDGDLQEGAPLAYVDNGDGTITDVNTGLVWEKLSNDGTIHDKDNQYTWANAFSVHVATLNSTNFAGHDDWRLPNVRELLSIANYQNILPSVSAAFDSNCASGCHVTTCSCTFLGDVWSSTSEADGPSNAWFVDFQDGLVATGGKSSTGPVRAVRGGATSCPLPATGQTTCWNDSGNVIPCAGMGQDGEVREGAPLAYVDNGDGTITDVNTGLVWEKLSNDGTVHDQGNLYTWANAFSVHVATLNSTNFAGHNDWRLPNVRELQSILDYQTFNPAVASAFDNTCSPGCHATTCSCTAAGNYWSSTSSLSGASSAWYVGFLYANVDAFSLSGGKNGNAYVRAVRSASSSVTTTSSSTTTTRVSTTTTTMPPTTSTTSTITSTMPSITATTTTSSSTTSSTIPTPTFIQGAAFSSPSRVSTATVALTHRPVAQGDLLVGWFSQYDAPGQVQVSDNMNGAWMRAPGSLTFMNDGGDIALYYRENSHAAPSGLTITVSASSATYLQGAVAEYSGIALAGSLDQVASARAVGTAVDTRATAAVSAGEVVFAALVTGGSPTSVTSGSSRSVPYTPRAQTANGSSYEEDITSSAAGAQDGTATLGAATDWYAVCAVFHPYPATPPVPPSTPSGLGATSVASTRVALAWSPPSTGSVAGYAVYRDGAAIGTIGPDVTMFLDPDVTPSTTHAYAVDAFDLVNDHSARSAPVMVTTPAASPEFVQGAATSSAERIPSDTLTLTAPVHAGDLLVGWVSQFDAPGQIQVSDNVNGHWTRSVSTTFSGTGDIALYYRENSAPAPSGLVITIAASAPTYLQGALAHYAEMAAAGALDEAMVTEGMGADASVGPSAPVPAGELVVAAVIAGGEPGSPSPGSSQMVPYHLAVSNGSASSDLEDILSSAAGPQQGSLTFGSATNWFMVLATFMPATATTTTTTGSITTTTGATTSTTSTTSSTTTTTIACGDVNGDGMVNIGDALLAAQYDVGLRQCGQAPFGHPEVCDVNSDGGCNIGDALRMAQCDVGLVSCLFSCRPFACP